MVLLVHRSDHEMIWLPDGDEVLDPKKHMIQSPKLMLTFVWNPHRFQVVDAMPCPQARYSRPPTTSEIFSRTSLLDVETDVKGGGSCMQAMQGHIQQE
jgi:hypothetical protein